MLYGKNREKNDINIDKDKDINGYMIKHIKIINDKSEVVNKLVELLDSTVNELQNVVRTDNYDSIFKKMKSNMFRLIKVDTIKKYNDKPPKTFNTIEKIFNRFICEKFMNEKYNEKVDKNKIVFYSIHKPIKGVKLSI